ncbi:BRO-N domain-containing protein [Shewanella algae]|uniref:BRO-N domain-containing protein n=1 Tax=Shewanella algae TaxID=38313 RepID=UPI001683C1B9|nr:BRO family protein [Shewanella algae]MBO2631621.1 hypothetical protein [Shewanella algae]QNV04334.1 hypothetical protein EIY89_03845 [Shewanella algae]
MKEKAYQLQYSAANGEVEIRTINRDGKILFCFPDVVQVLAKDNVHLSTMKGKREGFSGLLSKLSSVLKPKHREVIQLDEINEFGANFDFFITEAGLYKLLTYDESEAAERFQDWVFEDVLPSIRRHGIYPPPKEGSSELGTLVALLQQNVTLLAQEIEKREALENKVMTIDERITAIENESHEDLISIKKVLSECNIDIRDPELVWAWCEKIKLQSGADSKKSDPNDKLSFKYPLFVIEQAIKEVRQCYDLI